MKREGKVTDTKLTVSTESLVIMFKDYLLKVLR